MTSYFDPTYGPQTPNVVHSMNSTIRAEQELSILNSSHEIWHLTIGERYKRNKMFLEHLGDGQIYNNYCLKQFSNTDWWAQRNVTRVADWFTVEVAQANNRL